MHDVLILIALGVLAIAAGHDLALRTIPDSCSVALGACGLALQASAGSLAAAAAVFACGTLIWSAGWLGGGDIKLLSAATLTVPPHGVPALLIHVAFAGALLSLAYFALLPVARRLPAPSSSILPWRIARVELWRLRRHPSLPYGIAIAGGAVSSLLSG